MKDTAEHNALGVKERWRDRRHCQSSAEHHVPQTQAQSRSWCNKSRHQAVCWLLLGSPSTAQQPASGYSQCETNVFQRAFEKTNALRLEGRKTENNPNKQTQTPRITCLLTCFCTCWMVITF